MTKLTVDKTNRGFKIIKFDDRYYAGCSLQESSLATEGCIWLGIDDPDPKLMSSDAVKLGHPEWLDDSLGDEKFNGWTKFPVPDEVSMSTRMHLTVPLVEELLPYLNYFATTGYLPQKAIVASEVPIVEPINFGDEDTCDAKAARVDARLRHATVLQGHLHTPGYEEQTTDEERAAKRAEIRSSLDEVVAAFGLKLAE